MAESHRHLTGEDLARPAIHLPLKVLRELGRKLHRQLPSSGNWETLAEDLGYGFEDIHQFASLANVRQEITPGESMLLNWVQRSHGCTLFVLRSALVKADRQDCVEYLEREIYDKVVCMDLLFCVKDETTSLTEHGSVRTRGSASLIDSLQGALEEPITEKYSLLDRNASWVSTTAKEYKGRELMLVKKTMELPMEQDPTVDSSNPNLGSTSTFHLNEAQRISTSRSRLTQTLTRNSKSIENASQTYSYLTPNNLGQNSQEGMKSACNTFPMNIQITERKSINSTNSVQLEIRSGKGSFSNSSIKFSDESNMSYPTSIVDNDKTIGNHKATDIQVKDAQYVDDFDDVNYHDSSEEVFNTMINEDVNACTIQPCGSQTASFNVRTYVRSVETTDTAMLDMNSKANDDSDDDMLKAISAEYEDPNGFRPELLTEDDPIYNYARETSIEMDNSLTFLKEVVSSNHTTKHDTTENITSSQHTLTHVHHRSSHVKHETPTDHDHVLLHDEETAVYNEHRTDKDCYQLTGDPVYNSNCTMMYKDFNNVTEQGDAGSLHGACSTIAHSVRELSNTQKPINADAGLTPRCGRMTKLETGPGVNCKGEMKDPSHYSKEHIGKHQSIMPHLDPNIPRPGPTGCEGMAVFKQSMQMNYYFQDSTNDINTPDCTYIDFNNYPQNNIEVQNVDKEQFQQDDSAFDSKTQCIYNEHKFQAKQITDIQLGPTNDSHKHVRFANRCISQIETRNSQYESLNRQTSCPNFEYSSSVSTRPSLTTQFSTIAEVFSSTNDDSLVHELPEDDIDNDSHLQEPCDSYLGYKPDKQIHGKRNSYPAVASDAEKEQFKFARHSLPRLREKSGPGAGRSHTLPSVPVCDNQSGRAVVHSIMSKSTPSIQKDAFNYKYRVVMGGKTSRPLLDGCLADDKLFMHYNSELCGYKGWSPKEYEYTIDKTLADVKHENELYILWYHRTKKNLIITVTHTNNLLHFRVRTKVLNKQLFFFVSHAVMLPQVKQLLQYHHDNGLYVTDEQTVHMRLPVSVKYERTPVSV